MADGNRREAAIEFCGVCYKTDGRTIVSDLSLTVDPGETLVLLGRSGSGKTTALKLINRLLNPSEGQVRVEGKSVLEWDVIRLRRRIGYAVQEVGLFPHYTVEQNISLLPRLEKWPPRQTAQRMHELLELVSLPAVEFRNRYPHQLSGGQRQRVGLARALALDPPILLMDEPFGALDPMTRADLQGEFKRLKQRLHKAVVFVTHDVSEALLLGDRIALLDSGKLRGTYTPRQFVTTGDALIQPYLAALRTARQAME